MWHKRLTLLLLAIAPIILLTLCVLAFRFFSGGAGGQQLISNETNAVYETAPEE